MPESAIGEELYRKWIRCSLKSQPEAVVYISARIARLIATKHGKTYPSRIILYISFMATGIDSA
jgi:hypothetical protein